MVRFPLVWPLAALAAECFTPRLHYSGASIGFQLAAVFAGGPAPMIATAIRAATGSGQMIALYIFGCANISIVATTLPPSSRGRDFARDHIRPHRRPRPRTAGPAGRSGGDPRISRCPRIKSVG
jgi:hypothetical protein